MQPIARRSHEVLIALFAGGGLLLAIAALALAFAALAMPCKAWAWSNDVIYVPDKSGCPGTEITVTNLTLANTRMESLDPDCKVEFGANYWGNVGNVYRASYPPGTSKGNPILRIFSTRCGYTWDNRPVDMTLLCTGVTNSSGYDFIEWYTDGVFNGRIQFNNTNNTPNGSTSTWKLWFTYSDTGQVVPASDARYAFHMVDLDIRDGNNVDEGVWLLSGLDNAIYLQGGSTIDAQRFRDTGFIGSRGERDDETFKSGFATLASDSVIEFRWQGVGCGTMIGLEPMSYAWQKVSAEKSVSDEVLFECDVASFDVTARFPYHDASVRPQSTHVKDTLDDALDASRARATVKLNGTDVTSRCSVSVSGQTVTVMATGDNVWQGTVEVRIEAPVRAGYEYDGYATRAIDAGEAYEVPNVAYAGAGISGVGADDHPMATNEVQALVSWGILEVDVASANDLVSQLGANGCYSLAGFEYAVYADAECTQEVARITTGEDGIAVTGRLRLGTYWVREVGQGPGFAFSSVVDECGFSGLATFVDERENVPQSEALAGSVASKHDSELMSAGLRSNPLVDALGHWVRSLVVSQ